MLSTVPLRVTPFYWNPITLDYEIATTGGSGVGTEVYVTNVVPVTISSPVAVTGPLTDAQLRATPVPISGSFSITGGATEAKQDTQITSLNSIDSRLGTIDGKTPNLGQQLAALSSPVVLTAAQLASLTPPAAITGFNLEATQLLVKAKTDNIPALGQALAAGSTPIVLTAIQLAALTPLTSIAVSNFPASQPVTVASLPLPSGASTSGNQVTELASLATIAALSKTEDTVSADGFTGIPTIAIRQDIPGIDTSATQDYSGIKVDSNGRLWVNSDVLGIQFNKMIDLMGQMIVEARVQSELLAAGMNSRDSTDTLRADFSSNQYIN